MRKYPVRFRGGGFGGGDAHVKIVDGSRVGEVRVDGQIADSALIQSFYAYPAFNGGVNVALRDVDGDGKLELLTGAGPGGGPHVKIFDPRTGMELESFFAEAMDFRGGVLVK